MLCKNCPKGKRETIPGNGISEPPYISVVRCPFDNKYYHFPENDCSFTERLGHPEAKLLDFEGVQINWFDKDTLLMEWDGGKDDEGDEFRYQLEWQIDRGVLVFSKVYEDDTCYLRITAEEKAEIIKKMMGLFLRKTAAKQTRRFSK